MGEIGYRLIRAREARGLTLEDAERDTRISRRYLHALEDEQFEVIPAPVYARGFLRSYAQYLGMDPQEVLALFPRGDEPRPTNGTASTQASMRNPIPATSASRPTWRKPPRFDSGTTRPEPRARRHDPAPARTTGEYVIGAGQVSPPTRESGRADLTLRTPSNRRPATRTIVTENVIGESPTAATPTRRLERPQGEAQRNLIVVGATIGVGMVLAIAVFLIVVLGGDDEPTQGGGTATGDASATATDNQDTATAGTTGPQGGVIPSVIGESESSAVELIEAAGLTARVFSRVPSQQPAGTVIEQSPAPGGQLAAGGEVRIVVSTGP
jgi:hypothetical protein